MTQRMQELANEILRLQSELDGEIEKRRKALGWRIKEHLVEFEQGIVEEHRLLRKSVKKFLADSPPYTTLTAPVIYSLIVPLLLLDLFVTIYQAVCFPAYGIAKVRRGDYLVFDRHHLAYLNALEKLNCAYCSYANGLIAYVREIAGRTEQYWCPIKHARRVIGAHSYYARFKDYGDAAAFRAPSK